MSDPVTPRARAERAVEDVLVDRTRAAATAEAVLADPSAGLDAQAISWRVLTSVALHRGRLTDASRHADRSVDLAESVGDDELLGGALMTRMGVLISSGRAADAVADADRAEPLLPESARVRLLIQRGTALGLGLGRVEEAIAAYDDVERRFPDMEPVVEAVLTMNRGTQHSVRGDHRRALADFSRAKERYRELGNAEAESDVLLHQARAAARAGDVPIVFALHAEAEARSLFVDGDHRTPNDLADALLSVGLRREAEQLSRRALEMVDGTIPSVAAAESVLKIAEIRGAVGNRDDAQALCTVVKRWASERDNPGLALSASLVEAQLAVSASERVDVDHIAAVADRLDVNGRAHEAASLRIAGANRAVLAGQREKVSALLAPFGSSGPRNAPPLDRARWAHAAALKSLVAGRNGEAMRHASRGLTTIEQLRGAIGSMELRAAAADRAPELAEIGVRLAAETGRPRSLLRWAERQRAVALRLTERDARSQAPSEELARSRGSDSGADSEIEQSAIRSRRSRYQEPELEVGDEVGAVVAAVGDRALVEYVAVGDRLDAVVVHRGRVRHHVGIHRLSDVRAAVDRLLFGLRRLSDPSQVRADAAEDLVTGVGLALDRIVAAVPEGAEEVVFVPTGPLHLLPWSALPGCRERSVVIAPSARLWAQPGRESTGHRELALVAGPDVPAAGAEIDSIAELYGSTARRVDGSVDPVRRALGSARAVHIAAHGVFRNDHPQFSRLEFEDGPLFVHDLDDVAMLPDTVVLSACSVGAVGVLRGDEVLGFPAALLARGVGSVIAAMVPVEDGAAHDLMIELHRELRRDVAAPAALAAAAAIVRNRSMRHRAVADSFVAYGRRR